MPLWAPKTSAFFYTSNYLTACRSGQSPLLELINYVCIYLKTVVINKPRGAYRIQTPWWEVKGRVTAACEGALHRVMLFSVLSGLEAIGWAKRPPKDSKCAPILSGNSGISRWVLYRETPGFAVGVVKVIQRSFVYDFETQLNSKILD